MPTDVPLPGSVVALYDLARGCPARLDFDLCPTGREQYIVDFDDIIEGKLPDFEMKPDDLVYVPENWI